MCGIVGRGLGREAPPHPNPLRPSGRRGVSLACVYETISLGFAGAVPFHEVLEQLLALLRRLGRALRAGDAARVQVAAELGAEIGGRCLRTVVAAAEIEPDLR